MLQPEHGVWTFWTYILMWRQIDLLTELIIFSSTYFLRFNEEGLRRFNEEDFFNSYLF